MAEIKKQLDVLNEPPPPPPAPKEPAAEHAAPVFAPHVTMAGVVESPADAAARVLGRLVAGVPAFEVRLTAVGSEPEFFRSLYLRAEPDFRDDVTRWQRVARVDLGG